MAILKYDDYPSSCPPSSAVEVEGVFYRFCGSSTPTNADFMTHVDLNLNFPPKKLCEAKALSFFNSAESAQKLQKRFPNLRNKKLVKVNLRKNLGIGELLGSHLNLWEYREVNFFESVKDYLEEVS